MLKKYEERFKNIVDDSEHISNYIKFKVFGKNTFMSNYLLDDVIIKEAKYLYGMNSKTHDYFNSWNKKFAREMIADIQKNICFDEKDWTNMLKDQIILEILNYVFEL